MKSPKVSIVMPTYNIGRMVEETIASVFMQTYSNWELIIVDDLSTDNTREILNEISESDDRIHIHYLNVNMGAGNSRNVGIKAATGRFISFLDCDDIWLPRKIEKQVEHMLNTNAPISHTSYQFIDESGADRKGIVRVKDKVDLIHNLKFTEIGTSTAMIDLSLINTIVEFSSLRARQDLKLWIYLLGRGNFSYGLDIPLVKYRVRRDSVSSNKFKMLWVTFMVYIDIPNLPLSTRLSCYVSYVFNAINKRKSL